jgi:hypothetical protein
MAALLFTGLVAELAGELLDWNGTRAPPKRRNSSDRKVRRTRRDDECAAIVLPDGLVGRLM